MIDLASIRNASFSLTPTGYSPEEVDQFLVGEGGEVAAFFAINTSPLVSRSSRLTIETWPPFAISNASSCFSSPQSVRALVGLVG